jgi:hypothetical protein
MAEWTLALTDCALLFILPNTSEDNLFAFIG